jgi:hypothetical protein
VLPQYEAGLLKRKSDLRKLAEESQTYPTTNIDEIINALYEMKTQNKLPHGVTNSAVSISDICNHLVDIIMKEPKIKQLIMGRDEVLLKTVE